jgi:hypothetical protein
MEEAVPPKKKISLAVKLLLGALAFFIIVAILPKNDSDRIQSEKQVSSEALAIDEQVSIHFSREDYGEAWPLVGVESGQVYCVDDAVVFRADDGGQVYGLNGAAASYARAKGYDWKPIGDVQTVGKNINFMLEPGKKLCSK